MQLRDNLRCSAHEASRHPSELLPCTPRSTRYPTARACAWTTLCSRRPRRSPCPPPPAPGPPPAPPTPPLPPPPPLPLPPSPSPHPPPPHRRRPSLTRPGRCPAAGRPPLPLHRPRLPAGHLLRALSRAARRLCPRH